MMAAAFASLPSIMMALARYDIGWLEKASDRLPVALLREEEGDGMVELIRRPLRGISLSISAKYITL
jgi:hypothetical protein